MSVVYTAKCTVYIEVDSIYADGIGEAQREVDHLISSLRVRDDVNIARAIDIEILQDNKLREEPGISIDQLWYGDVCLDDGVR
jgi:hypothetical protein